MIDPCGDRDITIGFALNPNHQIEAWSLRSAQDLAEVCRNDTDFSCKRGLATSREILFQGFHAPEFIQ
ncbi:hypothetical protein GCM10011360_17800 [Primorskyibacter flagellatus]|uniref:Uncharacterized protein n=1 Tax=Primorskyibacter flagellatus TaxID=1387277 RepID=A0A917A6P5_9RHOB|nr:hypothetical protein [Primorskyibacter flagellatus]GGE30186.1 hypothetical protein GCM10011360_17800 [Primorskyibacter flagellatus]